MQIIYIAALTTAWTWLIIEFQKISRFFLTINIQILKCHECTWNVSKYLKEAQIMTPKSSCFFTCSSINSTLYGGSYGSAAYSCTTKSNRTKIRSKVLHVINHNLLLYYTVSIFWLHCTSGLIKWLEFWIFPNFLSFLHPRTWATWWNFHYITFSLFFVVINVILGRLGNHVRTCDLEEHTYF